MEVYGVRHKKTGKLMPSKMSRTGARGWSRWIPDEPLPEGYRDSGGVPGVPPRLFQSRKGDLEVVVFELTEKT
jgi:hypothetical protein